MWANRYFVFWAILALTVALMLLAATHYLSWAGPSSPWC
jgi:hypothetical protein